MHIPTSKNANPARSSVIDDPRWGQTLARDPSADGKFWYSVVTTDVYCRPSCSSRTASPKNVVLPETLDDARTTGFRACKRCNPDGPTAESDKVALVARACWLIEESEGEWALADLALD